MLMDKELWASVEWNICVDIGLSLYLYALDCPASENESASVGVL